KRHCVVLPVLACCRDFLDEAARAIRIDRSRVEAARSLRLARAGLIGRCPAWYTGQIAAGEELPAIGVIVVVLAVRRGDRLVERAAWRGYEQLRLLGYLLDNLERRRDRRLGREHTPDRAVARLRQLNRSLDRGRRDAGAAHDEVQGDRSEDFRQFVAALAV